jgi:alkaline phosphatase D
MKFLAMRKPSGPVVVTGDAHHHFVGDMRIDYRNPNEMPVGTELMGTSITSGGDAGPSSDYALRWLNSLAENPQARYFLPNRGYVVCSLDRNAWHADFRALDKVTVPGAPIRTDARFMIECRQPGAIRI